MNKLILRPGTKHLCALPDGYDDRTRIAAYGKGIVAVHPDKPPLLIHEDGSIEQINV